MTSIILEQNGLRSSSRKSISDSTDWCRRHKNVTNVSLSRCLSFNLGNRERKTVPFLYTGILIFWHLVGKGFQTRKVIWVRCALVHSDYITPSWVSSCGQLLFFAVLFKKHHWRFEDSKASLTTPWTKEQVLNFSNWKIA